MISAFASRVSSGLGSSNGRQFAIETICSRCLSFIPRCTNAGTGELNALGNPTYDGPASQPGGVVIPLSELAKSFTQKLNLLKDVRAQKLPTHRFF